MQPLLDSPPPVHPYVPGSWGPKEADELVARPRPLARALARRRGRDMERLRRRSSSAPAPAAARSPGTSPRPASGSSCSSAATGCRASRRTGTRRTSSSTTATSRPTPGTTSDGKAFQPQVHYFVGGATKLYGAALYRLRERGLRRAAPPRRHLARLADLLRRARAVLHAGRAAVRGARRPRRGPDRAAVERARIRSRPSRTSRGSSSSRTTSRPPATTRSTRRAGSGSTRRTCPTARACAAQNCDGFPCAVHGKSDAEVLGVRPALEHANVTLLTNAHAAVELETNEAGTAVTGVVVERDGETERFAGDLVVVACGAANTREAAARVGERQASERARQRLRPGRPQLHVPRSQAVLALSREENPTIFQKTLGLNDFYFSAATTSSSRSGTSRWSASRSRRCSAARSRTRRSSRRNGRSSRSRGTRSTSGSRPRICRGPRTG